MFTKIMKWVSIAALFVAVLWRSPASYQPVLQFVVCVGALLVALQAVRGSRYFWADGFTVIAVLFNPIVPVVLSSTVFLWLNFVCLTTFAVSLLAVRRRRGHRLRAAE